MNEVFHRVHTEGKTWMGLLVVSVGCSQFLACACFCLCLLLLFWFLGLREDIGFNCLIGEMVMGDKLVKDGDSHCSHCILLCFIVAVAQVSRGWVKYNKKLVNLHCWMGF